MTDRDLILLLQSLNPSRIAVLGDFMVDRYVWGDAKRVSPEAPVPVVHAQREDHRLGGAGNVVANICELGATAFCLGVVGDDEAGREMLDGLQALGADSAGMVVDKARPTIQKIRIMARNQQMLRVDRETPDAISDAVAQELIQQLKESEWQTLVLSDYGKGSLPEPVLREALAEANRRGVPALVDPKHRDFARYRGATLITPNRAEAEAACGESLGDMQELSARGEALRSHAGVEALLITLGDQGMYLLEDGQPGLHLATAARQVYDVTGAGDTVIAMLAVALAGGADLPESVRLSNVAAGLAVAKVGTTAVGRNELEHHLRAESSENKIITVDDEVGLQTALASLRREGRPVIFTNGCFDILHAGHVRYLRAARSLGDAMIVGLNDDDSVRRLKGAERPINQELDRAEVLAGLECVDLVVLFSEDTPENLIRKISPDVLVKGADYKDKGVVGAEFVHAQGGEVRLIDLVPGRSTSAIVERIREQ
jgi:D-beta-D-heptose 7-phosphate kinase / D-beta-D-heptose 1-phosphate adenosyltransferase